MNVLNMTGIIISVKMEEPKDGNTVANILLSDSTNPKGPVFKVALWDNDAETIKDTEADIGDELCVKGSIYCLNTNKTGTYIDIRQCKLLSVSRIERKQVFKAEVSEGDSDE